MKEQYAPSWMSEEAIITLKRGYLLPDETPMQMYKRLSDTAASYYPDGVFGLSSEEFAEQLLHAFINGWLSPASPVAANFGANNGNLPVSCYGIYVANTIYDIFGASQEAAVLTKNGGGLGIDISSLIGPSTVDKWAGVYNKVAEIVSQGGVRRGAFALYLDIEHPDYFAFIGAKDLLAGDVRMKLDCNIAIKCSDEFMQRLHLGDKDAVERFSKALELRMKYGSPYIQFTGNAQAADPPWYKDKGLATQHSQLCLLADELVLTKDGPRAIESLVGETTTIYDGKQWVENNMFRQIGESSFFISIWLGSGVNIMVTPEHRVMLADGSFKLAKHLQIGDVLMRHNTTCHGKISNPLACYEADIGDVYAIYDAISWDEPSKKALIRGLFGKAGTRFKHYAGIEVTDPLLANALYELLQSIGIDVWQYGFQLVITDESLTKLCEICPTMLYSEADEDEIVHGCDYMEVMELAIVELEEPLPVYCTTVPSTSAFALLNGTMTGNCSEIFLHSDKDHTYSCVLSSLNAAKYYEWLDYCYKGVTLPMLGIAFLDAVNEEFIANSVDKPGMEKAVAGAIKGRPLGLGVLGLHSLYMANLLPFDSEAAYKLNKELFAFVRGEAELATELLAKELGEPDWCRGYHRRNTHLLAVAPTTTNSVLCDAGSAGIEPVVGMYYNMAGAKGMFVRRNKYLEALLVQRGQNTESVWDSIRKAGGSVQHLTVLSDAEKAVFKTAFEIDQMHLIKQAADRQAYIDQGQSLNLFVEHDADSQYIVDLHIAGYKLGLKSLYYVRSSSKMSNASNKSSMHIHIKTREGCTYCNKAKKLLAELCLPYTESVKSTGRVPEVWVNGEMLDDGYTSLSSMLGYEEQNSACLACEG